LIEKVIGQIKQAERKASNLIEKEKQQTSAKIKNAQKDALVYIEKAAVSAGEEAKKILAKADMQAKAQVKKIRENNDEYLSKLEQKTQLKQESAINIILGELRH
jgi:vacuolar-type H+-ATPase subunit H